MWCKINHFCYIKLNIDVTLLDCTIVLFFIFIDSPHAYHCALNPVGGEKVYQWYQTIYENHKKKRTKVNYSSIKTLVQKNVYGMNLHSLMSVFNDFRRCNF